MKFIVLRVLRAGGVLAALVGIGLWSWRLATQGELFVWTDPARGFYLDDPDLGLVPTVERWLWLGLDGLAVMTGLLLATLLGLWLGRGDRAAHGLPRRLFAAGSFLSGTALLAAPVVPALALGEGMPPEGAVASLGGPADASPATGDATTIALPVPGGIWQLVPDSGLVVASVTAGGDTFEVRFGGLTGLLTVEPQDIGASRVTLSVDATTADAGIPLRSKHAREELKSLEHTTIKLANGPLRANRAPGGPVRWEGEVRVTIAGREVPAKASGELRLLGPAGRAKLGIAANEALLVEARVILDVASLPLDPKTFGGGTIPISARAVFNPVNTR